MPQLSAKKRIDRRKENWGEHQPIPGKANGLFVSRNQFDRIQTPKHPSFDVAWDSHWRPVLPNEILHDGPKHVLFLDRRTALNSAANLPQPDLRPPIKTPPKEGKIDMLRQHFRSFGFKEHEIDRELNKENWRKKKKKE